MKPEDFHCFKLRALTGDPHFIDEAGWRVLRERYNKQISRIYYYPDWMYELEKFLRGD